MSKVIMCDVDGVLANFNKGWRGLLNYLYPQLGIDENTSPSTWDEEPPGVTALMSRTAWNYIKTNNEFWERLEPLASFEEFRQLEKLVYQGHDLYFVTSRVGISPKLQTERWLRVHLPSLESMGHQPTVIVSGRKADIAQGLRADYVIDDKAGNVLAVYYQCPNTSVYLLDRPYNQLDFRVAGRAIRRVQTVRDFLLDVEAGMVCGR